jgi:hypothetical protein
MGMPVQHGRETWRSRLWRYVGQKKLKTFAFQLKFQRPNYTPIAVAQDDVQRPTQILKFNQGCRLTHITQMPNLIRCLQTPRQ